MIRTLGKILSESSLLFLFLHTMCVFWIVKCGVLIHYDLIKRNSPPRLSPYSRYNLTVYILNDSLLTRYTAKGTYIMRNLVSIKTIDKIEPIENADRIETAIIGGWSVVTQKGIHSVGDKVAYFEIDTLLPEDNPLFAEYVERGTKTGKSPYTGKKVKGHVLRTIKLRGQYSQGTIMPLSVIGLSADATQEDINAWMESNGVFKYEPPAAMTSGDIKGNFPSVMIRNDSDHPVQVRKTDSERVQNLKDAFLQSLDPEDWFATEKIDGTSFTAVCTDAGEVRIASRNYEIEPISDEEIAADVIRYETDQAEADKVEQEAIANGEDMETFKRPRVKKLKEKSVYQVIAEDLNLFEAMEPGQLIQGEIVGPNIQGNKLKFDEMQFFVFHTEGIAEGSDLYETVIRPRRVPVIDMQLPRTVAEAIAQVDGMKSTLNPKVLAEGVVWWNKKGDVFKETGMRPNFKAINNKFLLKHEE